VNETGHHRDGTIGRLHEAAARVGDVRFMEVCGTHTVNAFRSGLHSLMPPNVRLISGPGCPVCVTSQGEIDQLVNLALEWDLTLCTYGDMLRVGGRGGSLADARARGADVRVVYSAMDTLPIAAAQPDRQVVLVAVGFETTAPATAATLLEARRREIGNLTFFVSHKRIIPAMRALLESRVNLSGFLCPGHVAVIIGADAFRPIVGEYAMPCVIAGFEGDEIADALARLCELQERPVAALENRYPQAVLPQGNRHAMRLLEEVFEPDAVHWRGLGILPESGMKLRPPFIRFDARERFGLRTSPEREPAGCRCGDVITGRCVPADCPLFAAACTPVKPIGPCMVSSEGTCQAWFKYRRGRVAEPQEVSS
jgi:hydrogenase expression/formation protein HypD